MTARTENHYVIIEVPEFQLRIVVVLCIEAVNVQTL
jgi:hypothetical protein